VEAVELSLPTGEEKVVFCSPEKIEKFFVDGSKIKTAAKPEIIRYRGVLTSASIEGKLS
jgi:hypothetical protein